MLAAVDVAASLSLQFPNPCFKLGYAVVVKRLKDN